MRCPYCKANRDKVIDSRAAEDGQAIRRRRECNKCGRRFTTFEHVEKNTRLTVRKKDGSRVPFDRSKILLGLQRACYKRQVSPEQLENLVEKVEDALAEKGQKEIDAADIGEQVSQRLKNIDQVAYVRFASVYKEFRNIDELLEEVRDVMNSPRQTSKKIQTNLF